MHLAWKELSADSKQDCLKAGTNRLPRRSITNPRNVGVRTMRRFGVTIGAAILIAASAIPAGAGSLYSNGNSEAAQTLNFIPASHRSGDWHRDCHRHPVRHFIPGYGRVLHDHDGRRCRIDLMRRVDRRDRGDCIRIGDVKICV